MFVHRARGMMILRRLRAREVVVDEKRLFGADVAVGNWLCLICLRPLRIANYRFHLGVPGASAGIQTAGGLA